MMTRKDEILKAEIPPEHIFDVEGIAPSIVFTVNWVCWKWVNTGKKWTKVPIQANGNPAATNDPSTWSDFATVEQAATRNNWGIGFVFNDNGIVGIDLDDCRDPLTGVIDQWAIDIIITLGSYTEVSPSGTGVKVFVRGVLPEKYRHQYERPEGGSTEVYHKGRFFTVTGQRVPNTPDDVLDRPKKVETVLRFFNSWKPESRPTKSASAPRQDYPDNDDRGTALRALDVLDPSMCYDDWVHVGMALHSVDASDSMRIEWDNWSRQSDKFEDGLCEKKWKSFSGDGVGIGTLIYFADQTGQQWRPKRNYDQGPARQETDDSADEMPSWVEGEEPAPLKPLEAATDPHRLARLYLRDHHTRRDGSLTLVSWQGEFWWWNGSAYVPLKQHAIVASVTSCVKAEFDRVNLWEQKNFVPKKETDQPPKVQPVTKALLNNVVNAIASLTAVADEIAMPSWLCGDPPFPAREVLATTKTLLHLPSLIAGTSTGVSPTPMLFSANCLSYEFDQQAVCENWLGFLKSLWPNDPESIESLQEWFGYLLLPDTRQHKLLMLIGPPRSGKGTITRVLQLLLGAGNVASPTLSSLAGDFGLWPLLNKYVALIPDARLSGRDDSVAVVERILSLTGEDPQDIHRKCLPTLTGIRMPIRFVLMSNELPNLRDASGAFMTRVILLTMTESFVGREDRTLGDRLATELPGILNWSIEGWKRLNQRGYLLQPGSSTEMLTDLENLSSPIRQFVDDACDIGPGCAAPVDALFKAWAKWCEENHRDYTGNNQTFGRDLRAAAPHLKVVQRRAGERRERWYEGIRVRLDW